MWPALVSRLVDAVFGKRRHLLSPRPTFRPDLEACEPRVLLSPYYWVNTGGGAWSDAANWRLYGDNLSSNPPTTAPAASDVVSFHLPMTATVTLDGSQSAYGILVFAGVSVTLSGGNLSVGSKVGTVVLGGLQVLPGGALQFSGGELTTPALFARGSLIVGDPGGGPSAQVTTDSLAIGDHCEVEVNRGSWLQATKLTAGLNSAGGDGLIVSGGSVDVGSFDPQTDTPAPPDTLRVHPSPLGDETPGEGDFDLTNVFLHARTIEILPGDPTAIASLHVYGSHNTFEGELHNGGLLVLNGPFPGLLVNAIEPKKKGDPWVGGDYRQDPDATLIVQDGLYYEGTGLPSAVLSLEGDAHLAGTLRLASVNAFHPSVWAAPILLDSYASRPPRLPFLNNVPLLAYLGLQGRFGDFQGAAFEYRDGALISPGNPLGLAFSTDRFLGLDYEGTALAPMLLETPRVLRFDPAQQNYTQGPPAARNRLTGPGGGQPAHAENLVLIAPGTAAKVKDWPTGMGAAIAAHVKDPTAWDVAVLEWKEWNTGNLADLVNPDWQPFLGSTYGINIGESLAFWMQEVGLNYRAYHLISHSGGAWLVDSLANQLKANAGRHLQPAPFIHETVLDAFFPFDPSGGLNNLIADFNFKGAIVRHGFDFVPLVLGQGADYADQFLDTRQVLIPTNPLWRGWQWPNPAVPLTDSVLPLFFNVDVTALSPTFLPDPPVITIADYLTQNVAYARLSHGWPYVYYRGTVANPGDNVNFAVAFPYSYEFSGEQPRFDSLHFQAKEVAPSDTPPDPRVLYLPQGAVIVPHYTPVVIGATTGDVNPGGLVIFAKGKGGFEMKALAGRPTVLTARVSFRQQADVLALNYAVVAGVSSGALSIAVDGRPLATLKSADFAPLHFDAVPSLLEHPLGWIPGPGKHVVTFRLDTIGTAPADVRISGLSFHPTTRKPTPDQPPVNTTPHFTLKVLQDGVLAFTGRSHLAVSDPDAGTQSLRVTLTASHGTLRLDHRSGPTLTLTGSLETLNRALAALTFHPGEGFVGAAGVKMTTNDLGHTGAGGPRTDTAVIRIRVVARKPAPRTLPDEGSHF